ncbi:MAG TPA: PHP domain-containing protein [Candidatus Deferrimicrobium sp.]|nr:PHP domain-containing protein [Candidatus Deferrimicrobium sp.]
MKPCVDLHLHTHYSDGTTSPADLLEIVRSKGLSAFAVTDHDTMDGYWAVRSMLRPTDPELVVGLELSVTVDGGDLHLLGYLFDPENMALITALAEFRLRRNQRARLMVQRLNDMGIEVSFEDVQQVAGEAPVGRPHVADALVSRGAVRSYDEAFEKYIRNGGPAYVAKKNFTPEDALNLLHDAGGVAMLAHPVIDDRERHLEMLVGMGLDGVEAYHPVHRQSDVERLKHAADRYRLLVTGGSDFHGRSSRYGLVGSQNVPVKHLDEIKLRAAQRRGMI